MVVIDWVAIRIVALTIVTGIKADTPPGFNPVGTIDWNFFADEFEFNFKTCICTPEAGASSIGTKAGWKVSLVEPIGLMDQANKSWKFPSFGIDIDNSVTATTGTSAAGMDESRGFKHTHFIIYPIFSILNFVQEYICFERASLINFGRLSEIDPSSKNDIIAGFTKPQMTLFNNPIATLACAGDCAASTIGSPINSMFWCAGCWYPIGTDSKFNKSDDPILDAATLALKDLDQLHRTFALTKSSDAVYAFPTESTGAVQDTQCKEKIFLGIIKSQYSLQLALPTVWDAFTTGVYGPTVTSFKNKITSEDDVVFWLWRKRDFCAGAYDCRSTFGNLQ